MSHKISKKPGPLFHNNIEFDTIGVQKGWSSVFQIDVKIVFEHVIFTTTKDSCSKVDIDTIKLWYLLPYLIDNIFQNKKKTKRRQQKKTRTPPFGSQVKQDLKRSVQDREASLW